MTSDPPAEHGTTPFDQIRHATADDGEFWSARELARVLGYTEYGKFRNTIRKAEIACVNSGHLIEDHFAHVSDMIRVGKGARRRVADVHLSRYACYLVVQNADPEKPVVALGMTYFAMQTQRAEQAQAALAGLSAAHQRLYLHNLLTNQTRALAATAQVLGVVDADAFAIFQDHGYRGLYGGLGAQDLRRRKGLDEPADLTQYMGRQELATNLFHASQTEGLLRQADHADPEQAQQTHYEVGNAVRDTITRIGGILPEDLPTPPESIAQLRAQERQRLLGEAGPTSADDNQ